MFNKQSSTHTHTINNFPEVNVIYTTRDHTVLFIPKGDSFVDWCCSNMSEVQTILKSSFLSNDSELSSLPWYAVIFLQSSCTSLKVLEFFLSRFSRPGKSLKTDMVLESPWVCVWRSLKVLELDFLKRRDQTSDCYHQMHFLGSNVTEKQMH